MPGIKDEDVERYSHGECGAFALALARVFGYDVWLIGIPWHLIHGTGEPYGEFCPGAYLEEYAATTHFFCVKNGVAIDVTGKTTVEALVAKYVGASAVRDVDYHIWEWTDGDTRFDEFVSGNIPLAFQLVESNQDLFRV